MGLRDSEGEGRKSFWLFAFMKLDLIFAIRDNLNIGLCMYMFYISKSIHSSTLAVTRTGTWRLQGPKMASGILERKTRRSMRLPCSQGHWHTSCPHTGDQDTHAHSHTHTCRGTDSLLHTLMQTKSPFNWKKDDIHDRVHKRWRVKGQLRSWRKWRNFWKYNTTEWLTVLTQCMNTVWLSSF